MSGFILIQTRGFSDAVTVLVGASEVKFIVHKELLAKKSAYFAKATTGVWTEAQTGVFRLVDEHDQIFELFVQWLYSGSIQVVDATDLQYLLICAWSFGDRVQAPGFKNVVINMLFEDWALYYEGYPHDCDTAVTVYEASPPGSALRKLVVDKFAAHPDDNVLNSLTDDLPPAFLADLSRTLLENVYTINNGTGMTAVNIRENKVDRLEHDICERYHEHEVGCTPCSTDELEASYQILRPDFDLAELEDLAPFQHYVLET